MRRRSASGSSGRSATVTWSRPTIGCLLDNRDHWLVSEVILYLKRVLKRIDVSARSLFALIEPGSCFSGSLLELALAADRAYMLQGAREGVELPRARLSLSG